MGLIAQGQDLWSCGACAAFGGTRARVCFLLSRRGVQKSEGWISPVRAMDPNRDSHTMGV